MEYENVFSKSSTFTQEYCCTVVRINELIPIDGADKIAQTMVNGESIVVRKDQVHEGDVLIYASNETELHEGFLSANNLFDVEVYDKNSNADEVREYVERRDMLKASIDSTNKLISKMSRAISKGVVKQMADFVHRYDKDFDASNEDALKAKASELLNEEVARANNARDEVEELKASIKSKCGFFNKYGRVRLIRLKGIPSFGYLFTIQELGKWMNERVMDVNLEEHVGEDFDTVCGELFVKAYVPRIKGKKKTKVGHSLAEKRSRRAEKRFNRLIDGQFKFHYDTNPLARNMHLLKPDTMVTITDKLHGTSICIAKVKVKVPIKLPFHQRIWNKICDNGLLYKFMVKDYVEDYGPIFSSRKEIRNKYISNISSDNQGYYKKDIWNEYGELIYKYLENGMTLYGEIVGYVGGESDKMIQKGYDYGCEKGTNKLMPYRITTMQDDGRLFEWSVQDVYDWTVKMIEGHEDIADRLLPIDILYHGTLGDAYPQIDKETHWNENVLQAMKDDEVLLGMNLLEPKCENLVPREGVVLRIDGDEVSEAFKLKSLLFKEEVDLKQADSGEVDMEMSENYLDGEEG